MQTPTHAFNFVEGEQLLKEKSMLSQTKQRQLVFLKVLLNFFWVNFVDKSSYVQKWTVTAINLISIFVSQF